MRRLAGERGCSGLVTARTAPTETPVTVRDDATVTPNTLKSLSNGLQ
jgi:hypothetical protein